MHSGRAGRTVRRIAGGGLAAALLLVGFADAAPGGLDASFGSRSSPGVVPLDTHAWPYREAAIETAPDGSLLVGTRDGLRRYTAGGSLDRSFGSSSDGRVDLGPFVPVDISVAADGAIVVAGSRDDTGTAGSRDPVVMKLSADGIVDTTFDGSIWPDRYGVSRLIEVGDRIVVSSRGTRGVCLHRMLASDGRPDTTFGPSGDGQSCILASGEAATHRREDGSYVVSIVTITPSSGSSIQTAELDEDGQPVGAPFPWVSFPGEAVQAAVATRDGSLLVARGPALARYRPGSPSPSFDIVMPGLIQQVVELDDGRLLVAVKVEDFSSGGPARLAAHLYLYTADGVPDGAFAPGTAEPNRIVVPRYPIDGLVPDGTEIYDATTTSDGRVVLFGSQLRIGWLDGWRKREILVRTNEVGPSMPIRPLSGPAVASRQAVRLGT